MKLARALLCAAVLAIIAMVQFSPGQNATPAAFVKSQYFTSGGVVCASCKLYTYAAGTTTNLATCTTPACSAYNTTPVVLDSAGRADVWLTGVSYKLVLKTSADVTIWTVDNVPGLAIYGTANKLPMFTAANTIGDSPLIVSGTSLQLSTGYNLQLEVIRFIPVTPPSTPASGFVMYVDSANSNILKVKSAGGTVTTLANQ